MARRLRRGDVAVTLRKFTQAAELGSGGAFSTTFNTAGLNVSSSPYTTTYSYTSDGTFVAVSMTSSLTVNKATPTVNVVGSTIQPGSDGHRRRCRRSPTGPQLEGVGLSLSYYSGAGTSARILAPLLR